MRREINKLRMVPEQKEGEMRKRLFLISMLGLMLAGGTITYADVDYSSETIVKEVQTALNKEGYDCGTPDGKAGSATKQAISDYRKDKGYLRMGISTGIVRCSRCVHGD